MDCRLHGPQAPLSIGLPRQEYWRELPFLSPGDLPDPGIELRSSALEGRFFTLEPPGKPLESYILFFKELRPLLEQMALVIFFFTCCPLSIYRNLTASKATHT